MARTLALSLTALVLAALLLAPGSIPAAGAAGPARPGAPAALLVDEESPTPQSAGHKTGDPLYDSELPIAPVLGGTAALLVLLCVIAVRRGWVA